MPYTPPYAQQIQKTLEAQLRLAPELFQANEAFAPLYQSLDLQNLNQFLNGTPEQTYQTYQWEPPKYRQKKDDDGGLFGDFGPGSFFTPPDVQFGMLGPDLLAGGPGKHKELVRRGRFTPHGTGTRAAQKGFLQIYDEDIMPALYRERSEGRAADIDDVSTLGPEMREALRRSDPDSAALLDLLSGTATDDLALGASLNPSESRNIAQASRAGQSARGMGFGPNDNFEEALTSLNYGRELQDRRRGYAAGTLGLLSDFYGDPFERVLGRSDPNSGLGIAGGAMSGSKQDNLFNPESDYAGSIFNTIFNANLAEGLAAKNNRAAITSAGISAAGSLLGGASSMI